MHRIERARNEALNFKLDHPTTTISNLHILFYFIIQYKTARNLIKIKIHNTSQ